MPHLVDTNVMWRRFDPADQRQPIVRAVLDELFFAGETVFITPQNLIEFQALATRPINLILREQTEILHLTGPKRSSNSLAQRGA